MPLTIGVPREVYAGEKRVASVPDVVEKLIKLGFAVVVESGAGDAANFSDDTYRAAGAEIADSAAALWAQADLVFKVRAPSVDEVSLHEGRRHADQLHLARPEPGTAAKPRRQEGDGTGH